MSLPFFIQQFVMKAVHTQKSMKNTKSFFIKRSRLFNSRDCSSLARILRVLMVLVLFVVYLKARLGIGGERGSTWCCTKSYVHTSRSFRIVRTLWYYFHSHTKAHTSVLQGIVHRVDGFPARLQYHAHVAKKVGRR